MSLLDILRGGVRICDRTTKSLQPLVTYERYLGEDAYGADSWAPPVQMRALCDWKLAQVATGEGIMAQTRVLVSFLDIDEMVKFTNGDGIGEQDKITLPDGTTGPILDLAGFIDAGTGVPLATDVSLG